MEQRPDPQQIQSDPRARLRGMIIAISAITGVGIGLSVSLPLLGIVLETRGISETWIGINTAMAGIAAIAISPYCTPLAKAFGTARILVIAILVAAISLFGFYLIKKNCFNPTK